MSSLITLALRIPLRGGYPVQAVDCGFGLVFRSEGLSQGRLLR